MGYLAGNQCLPGKGDVVLALAAAASPGPIVLDGVAYMMSIQPTADKTMLVYKFAPFTGSGATVNKYVAPAFTACDDIAVEDAVLLSWAVAACWLCAYAFKVIKRGIHV